MDEEKKTEAQETPQVAQTKPEASEQPEHVEQAKEPTQPTSEAHVEEQDAGTSQSDTPDWEEEKKRLSGKISKLEKDSSEYQQAKQILDALNSAAAEDPDFMKVANKKLVEKGVLDASVLEQLEQVASSQPQASGQPVDPAIQWAKQKMQEEKQKKEQFFVDFEEKHPDLQEGDDKVIRANRSAIGAAAAKRMAEDNVSMEEAYEFAYKLIMNPKQLIEEGKLEGIAQAQLATPAEGAASGGSASSSGTATLTPEQKEAARLFGLSEEEYAKSLED
jgi:hypothetical protein